MAMIYDFMEGENFLSIDIVKSFVKVAIPHFLGGKVPKYRIHIGFI